MSRQQKIHEVVSPRNAKASLIDHPASRALAYRQRAIELAEAARHEDDKGQRRFLVDKARALVNVADEIDPPLDEPHGWNVSQDLLGQNRRSSGHFAAPD